MTQRVQQSLKYSRTRSVHEILELNNCDPLSVLCQIATGNLEGLNVTPNMIKYYSIRQMQEAASELAQYVYAKVKPRDAEIGDEANTSVVILPDNGSGSK